MNTEKCTVAQLAELNLCHYITMRRGDSNADFTAHSMEAILDYTSQSVFLEKHIPKKRTCFFQCRKQ